MKILVTGGAGFIGSHIVDALVDEGVNVIVVDNISSGSEQNINKQAKFYQVNITDSDLRRVFEIERPDVVSHQAAHTVVTRSLKDPTFDAKVNILGSLNVIANCIEFGVKKIVYASSCAIYGYPQYIPVDEIHPLNSISPYGVSKQTVERYLNVYHNIYGINYLALRYANVYGPRQNPMGEAGVVAIFARQMLSNERPTIYGAGDKTRSYIYVGDIVRANLLAIEFNGSGVYNIGTSEETTDQQIFGLMSGMLGYGGSAKYEKERPGEIKRMLLNCSKAKKELNWTSQVSLEEGIELATLYYREHKELCLPKKSTTALPSKESV